MRLFRLTVKAPGSLLSRLLEADITPDQFALIDKIIREPNEWLLVSRALIPITSIPEAVAPKKIGFEHR